MTTPNEIEQSYASSAIAQMAARDIVPTPENYTVWYHYISGKHAELKSEIDKIIAQKGSQRAVLPNSLADLHHRPPGHRALHIGVKH